MSTAPALVLIFRRPALGIGKQRIARDLGAAAARDIGVALLDCALEDAATWPGPVVLAPAEAADASWAATLLVRDVILQPQPAGNLGERLAGVDDALRQAGPCQLLFIGSDAPALNDAAYAQARTALASADVVLAPAHDGGVTLMGARVAWPPLADLPWGESTLGAALADRCRERQLSVATTQTSFDIDAVRDLTRAALLLANDQRPARQRLCTLIHTLRLARTG